MQTPFWNNQHFLDQAVKEWNQQQPAWKPVKKYTELTPAQQSLVDERAQELELTAMLVDTADSVRRIDC